MSDECSRLLAFDCSVDKRGLSVMLVSKSCVPVPQIYGTGTGIILPDRHFVESCTLVNKKHSFFTRSRQSPEARYSAEIGD